MSRRLLLVILIILIIISVIFWLFYRNTKKNIGSQKISTPTATTSISSISTPTPTPIPTASPTETPVLANPVADFRARVTKKPFGIYITPQNSPIQPERFTGYHTGADAEYQDVTDDVAVYAVADGKVVLSEIASGYGGVFMLEIDLEGAKHTVIYSHIRPSTLPKVGQNVTRGEQIGLLGTGYSTETDGERRHLHFAILSDNRLDIKGYVQSQSQLSGWLDPLNYY